MSTKKLLKELKAMRLEVAYKNGLDTRALVARRILTMATETYGLQRQYELMHADNPDATCKKFTDDELPTCPSRIQILCWPCTAETQANFTNSLISYCS